MLKWWHYFVPLILLLYKGYFLFDYKEEEEIFCNKKFADLSPSDIVKCKGYPLEKYEVVTDDGYILELYRIPYGKHTNGEEKEKNRQPVLLLPGLACSWSIWIVLNDKSGGFNLADKGNDVWLGNYRGSTYGKKHKHLSTDDKNFWDFSFHEIGTHDIPAILDFIYHKTKRDDIIIVGNSLGSTIQTVYAAERPEHAQKRVKLIVYIAPTIYLVNVRSMVSKLAPILQYFENYRKFELLHREMRHYILPYCSTQIIGQYMCQFMSSMICGFNNKNYVHEDLLNFLSHWPEGTSIKTIWHISQGINKKKFAKYDYGSNENKIVYQSSISPEYNLSRIRVPGIIFYAANDDLASEEDVMLFYQNLPKNMTTLYKIKDEDFTHGNFFIAKNVKEEFINPFLEIMEKYAVHL